MKVKTTAPGAPIDDLDLLMGDPFAPKGERYHDRPPLDAVNRDIAAMDNQFGDLHLDLGAGPVRFEGPAADDLRHRLERNFRDRQVVGYDTPEQMFADGAPMPQTVEQAMLYSSGETREGVAQQQAQSDALLREYQARYPDLATDMDGLSQAIDVTLEYYGDERRPSDDFHQFLKDVSTFHRSGVRSQRSQYADAGRTSGISSGAPVARGNTEEPKGDLVDELQAIQRRSGFY